MDTGFFFNGVYNITSRECYELCMNGAGYNNLANLPGGISDREREGFPVRVDLSRVLSAPVCVS